MDAACNCACHLEEKKGGGGETVSQKESEAGYIYELFNQVTLEAGCSGHPSHLFTTPTTVRKLVRGRPGRGHIRLQHQAHAAGARSRRELLLLIFLKHCTSINGTQHFQ